MHARVLAVALFAALNVAGAGVAMAQAPDLTRGTPYRAVADVSQDLAQLVVLRKASPAADAARKGAHVYIDGSLNTALLPQTFTTFCVAPGSHTVEAYIGDAPLYAGKTQPKTRVDLAGGKTYFVAVSDSGAGELLPYSRKDMETQLASAHELRYIINRASAVVPCDYLPTAPATVYTFRSDVLFAFGRGDPSALTGSGRQEVSKVAADIAARSQEGPFDIVVRGHADPIGRSQSNMQLSRQRAQTIRGILVDGGVPRGWIRSEGVGSSQGVVNCSKGPATRQRVDCNAPNRRVEVIVEPSA